MPNDIEFAKSLKRFNDAQSTGYENRIQALEDRRFCVVPGAQWEGEFEDQFENKPRPEVNKVLLSMMRIINEYRNSRITVDFVAKDGSEDDKLADFCDGLFRSDEELSTANEAYDTAFEEGSMGGYGAWRLRAGYEDEYDEDDDKQRIFFEPITDAESSVFFNVEAKRYDKADADECWVLVPLSPEYYKKEYNDDPSTWPKAVSTSEFEWSTPDVTYIAENYRIEETKETIFTYEDFEGSKKKYREDEFEDDPGLKQKLILSGHKYISEKKITVRKVHKYILGGNGELRDEGIIAGKHIPIIPYFGRRWIVDGVERCLGHVGPAKDVQRLKNSAYSYVQSLAALSPKEKPVVTPEMIAGHENMWADDNIKDYPYLVLNPITNKEGDEQLPQLQYTKAPQIPPALAALLQMSEMDMQEILGKQAEGEQMVPNLSGKAVELIQERLDMQVYIYMSNLAKSVKRCGEVWLSMAQDVYVEDGRTMKTIGKKKEVGSVTLRQPVIGKDGGIEYKNDIKKAKLDLVVEVGPSSSTKRSATVRALTSMIGITQDPEAKSVLGSAAVMNMEGEGISDIREYFRKKMIRMGVVKPTDNESEELAQEVANQPPDPQEEFIKAAAQKEVAQARKYEADTDYSLARATGERAETIKTLSEVDQAEQQKATEEMQALAGPSGIQPAAQSVETMNMGLQNDGLGRREEG